MDRNDREAIDNMPQDNDVDALMMEIQLRRGVRRDMERVAALLRSLSELITDEEFADFCRCGLIC